MVVGFLSWDGAVSEAFLGEQAPRSHRRGYHPLGPEVWLHLSLVMTGYAGGAAEPGFAVPAVMSFLRQLAGSRSIRND